MIELGITVGTFGNISVYNPKEKLMAITPSGMDYFELKPEDIDLVICPCTSFDEELGRMGMGAGYYDRYLEKCSGAHIVAVAFECQKADSVMRQEWDKPMEKVFTEEKIYE